MFSGSQKPFSPLEKTSQDDPFNVLKAMFLILAELILSTIQQPILRMLKGIKVGSNFSEFLKEIFFGYTVD